MAETFFEQPILNSPYENPIRYHELDKDGAANRRAANPRAVPFGADHAGS